MRGVGWVLDVHVGGSWAYVWVKLDGGKAVCLSDRYRPDFYVELKDGLDPHDMVETILLHPSVLRASVEEKYASILDRERSKVVHVYAKDTSSFKAVRDDVEKLNVVKSWFSVDLYHFQRYLFSRTFAPTSKVEVEWNEDGKLVDIAVVDDSDEVRPPPFSSLIFEATVEAGKLTPDARRDPVRKIALRHGEGDIEALEGSEANILTNFSSRVKELDPDFLVANDCEETLGYILGRADILGLDLRLGRGPIRSCAPRNLETAMKGRAIADLDDFLEYGVAGITQSCLVSPWLRRPSRRSGPRVRR